MTHRRWFVLAGGARPGRRAGGRRSRRLYGNFSPRGYVADHYTPVGGRRTSTTTRAAYTSTKAPSEVADELTGAWEPADQYVDGSGVYLRYADDAVVILPPAVGSLILVERLAHRVPPLPPRRRRLLGLGPRRQRPRRRPRRGQMSEQETSCSRPSSPTCWSPSRTAAVGVVLMGIGYVLVDVATPGKLRELIWIDRNRNAALLLASNLAGVGIIVVAAIMASDDDFARGIVGAAAYGLLGLVVMAAAFVLLDLVTPGPARRDPGRPAAAPGDLGLRRSSTWPPARSSRRRSADGDAARARRRLQPQLRRWSLALAGCVDTDTSRAGSAMRTSAGSSPAPRWPPPRPPARPARRRASATAGGWTHGSTRDRPAAPTSATTCRSTRPRSAARRWVEVQASVVLHRRRPARREDSAYIEVETSSGSERRPTASGAAWPGSAWTRAPSSTIRPGRSARAALALPLLTAEAGGGGRPPPRPPRRRRRRPRSPTPAATSGGTAGSFAAVAAGLRAVRGLSS